MDWPSRPDLTLWLLSPRSVPGRQASELEVGEKVERGARGGRSCRSGEGRGCHLYWAPTVCLADCDRSALSQFYLDCLIQVSPQPGARVIISSALTEKETETQGCYVTCPRSHSLSGVKPGSQPRSVCLQWVLSAARKSSSWKSGSGVGVFSQNSSGSPEANLLSSALLLLTHLPGKSQVSPLPRPLPQPQVLARLCLAPRPSLVPPRWL